MKNCLDASREVTDEIWPNHLGSFDGCDRTQERQAAGCVQSVGPRQFV
jgi:hypothetical protein